MTFRITGPGFYHTRDGRKAEVVGRSVTDQGVHWVGMSQDGVAMLWRGDGSWIDFCECSHDLIAPWTESAKGEFWTNVFKSKDGAEWVRSWIFKCDADENAAYVESKGFSRRIACIRTLWVEGEGL